MSRLAQKTERKAITVLTKVLPYFDRLDHVEMSADDAFDTAAAQNLIRRVIESNPQRQRNIKK